MSCNCENNACLELAPNILQCGEDIVTLVMSDYTGSVVMSYEFNGRWFGEQIEVTSGEFIEMPNVFNESYTHLVKFYKTNTDIINDTCYSLDTSLLMGVSSGTTSPSSSGFNYANVTAEAGNTIDFSLGTPVVVFDGNQSYIQGQFTYSNGVITMTNGVTFYDGQPLTILYV